MYRFVLNVYQGYSINLVYILCIGFICILLFINDVITMPFIDVIMRALYIFEMQFDFECVFSGCLLHIFKMFVSFNV